MEALQNLLTAAINITAIAGFGGILAHALYTWHLSQIPTAPQSNPDYQRSELLDEILEAWQADADAAQGQCLEDEELTNFIEQGFAHHTDHKDTSLEEVEQREDEKTVPPQQIDLSSLDPVALRKLCTQHSITWRNVRGRNRHATKGMMIHQLQHRFA